jgi:hypothetical protein
VTNSFLVLVSLLSALPYDGQEESARPSSPSVFQSALTSADDGFIVRGQSPGFAQPGVMPAQPAPMYGQPMPAYGQPMPGYNGGMPMTSDPWLNGGSPVYQVPPTGPQYTFGVNGPAPRQYGLAERIDFTYMPSTGTSSPDVGDFGVFAVDFEKEYTFPLANTWSFGMTPRIGARFWDGPTNGGTSSLPGEAFSFGLGLKIATPEVNGWSAELGFDPTLATDFQSSIGDDALLYDGHAVAFWRASPQFTVALGVAYWDRVDQIVLPYAGVVWQPNDLWEFRLLFPKPRISYFMGTPGGVATWAYVEGEYHVEAFQVDTMPGGVVDRVQLADWRVVGGLRFEAGWLTSFIEAGWVFNRSVEFQRTGTDFDVNDGFITRAGIRF